MRRVRLTYTHYKYSTFVIPLSISKWSCVYYLQSAWIHGKRHSKPVRIISRLHREESINRSILFIFGTKSLNIWHPASVITVRVTLAANRNESHALSLCFRLKSQWFFSSQFHTISHIICWRKNTSNCNSKCGKINWFLCVCLGMSGFESSMYMTKRKQIYHF